MKLCLGTVQFGIDYGIRGRQKPSREESLSMLDYAVRHGVDAIDASALYGDAEEIVGEFLSKKEVRREDLFVVSKFGLAGFDGLSGADCGQRVLATAGESLLRLGVKYLDAFICHVPTAVFDERIVYALGELRKSGMAKRVGFSVYETQEAVAAIETGIVDFLQIPFSVLDQRMAAEGILDRASQAGVMLHSRSAFVQGLALMDPNAVPDYLARIRPKLVQLEELCQSAGVSRRDLALAFVRSFPQISHLVFGVHDQRQLAETIGSFAADVPQDIIDEAGRLFAGVKPELVMPNKWSKLK